jgi:hypothetical protein
MSRFLLALGLLLLACAAGGRAQDAQPAPVQKDCDATAKPGPVTAIKTLVVNGTTADVRSAPHLGPNQQREKQA